MTTNDNHDPVNRWATEHYGFADGLEAEPVAPVTTNRQAPPPSTSARRRPPSVGTRRRHRTALIASGVLGLAMIGGIGGAAVAAAADAGGGGGGGGPARERVAVVQFDGDGGDRTGDPGGGHR